MREASRVRINTPEKPVAIIQRCTFECMMRR